MMIMSKENEITMKSTSTNELGSQNQEVKRSSTLTASMGTQRLKRSFSFPRMSWKSKRKPKNHQISYNKDDSNSPYCNNISNLQEQEINNKYQEHQRIQRIKGGGKIFTEFFNTVKKTFKRVRKQNHKLIIHDGFSSSAGDVRVTSAIPAHIPPDKVPGVIGLRNHGNTCFMNAVLQCLSHTDVLAEYFVLDQYKSDLPKKSKLNPKKYGTKGEITEKLADLLKAIWSCQYDPEMSMNFKSVVEKYGSQYRGNLQHDAQEFLLWLLDKVHEELNQATNKKYKPIKHNSFGRPDQVAHEAWKNYASCNNSKVHAIFQAQFRSSLTCPRCNEQSNTFDPFLCVSVPVLAPQSNPQIGLIVTVLYTSQQPRQVRIGVNVSQSANIKELREILASDTGVDENHMLLTEVHEEGFHRTFSNCQPVSVITDNDPLYCIELPQLKEPTEQAYILLVWINVIVKGDMKQRFGSPYTMQVSRETSYEDLQKLLLKEMHASLADDVLTSSQCPGLFSIRVADPAATPVQDEHPCIDPSVEHPLYTEQIEQALALCADDSGPQHVKLILEWNEGTKNNIVQDDSDQIEEHASVKQLKSNLELNETVTLEKCFDLYTREEVLGVEDAWHCPNCNKKREVVKKLGLWSLPDILVIHLKRFRQQSKQRSISKLTMLVDFPLYGFDMTPHLAHNGIQNHNNVTTTPINVYNWSPPWKKSNNRIRQPPNISKYDENVYDLYAICNHHGSDLQGGHYTAYCRNPYNGQWYCFDDTRVEEVNITNLVTSSAYILFYQKRGLANSSTGSSSAASTSSSGSGLDHWVSRMQPFHYNSKTHNNNNDDENKKNSDSQDEQEKVVEEKNKSNFNKGKNNSPVQQTKMNNATETEDNGSEESTSIKTVKENFANTTTPQRIPVIIGNCENDENSTAVHESTL